MKSNRNCSTTKVEKIKLPDDAAWIRLAGADLEKPAGARTTEELAVLWGLRGKPLAKGTVQHKVTQLLAEGRIKRIPGMARDCNGNPHVCSWFILAG